MVSWIADCVTQMLITSLLIEEGDRELYSYGLFMLISRICFFLVAVIAGLVMGIPIESVLFYVSFMLLRTHAGGIHAQTETACTILTTLALLACIFGIKFFGVPRYEIITFLMLGIGSLCILLFSPLDSIEKKLDPKEKRQHRTISLVFVLMCITVALVARGLSHYRIFCAITCGIFLESVLLVVGKIHNLRHDQ